MTQRQTDRGVVYCATGVTAYLEAALISAIALHQLEPDLPITLISDLPLLNLIPLQSYSITPRFISPEELQSLGSFASRAIKTRLDSFTPYQETLFIDADVLPLRSLSQLWGHLDRGDWGMVADLMPRLELCNHVATEEKDYTLCQLPGSTPHFNSGVMLWRKNAVTQTVFQQWHQEWLRFQKQDQLALMRAIDLTQLPIVPLPATYNISPIDAPLQDQPVYLLHCWGGQVGAGKFPQIARQYCPLAVEVASWLLAEYVPDPVPVLSRR
jgi:Glycosyl transferase family 8